MHFLTVLSLGATLLTWTAPFAMAVCCETCPPSGLCSADRSQCEPGISCCGRGQCNIFCCNCDNGCRPPTIAGGPWKPIQDSLRGIDEVKDCKYKVDNFDLNGDGNINFLEWTFEDGFASQMPMNRLAERWLKYDTEGKGYLTVEEAYHRKA